MTDRRSSSANRSAPLRLTARWVAAGTVAMAAATGIGAQTGALDTSEARWVHHLLYGVAVAACATAAVVQATLADRRRAAMAPALLTLAGLARTRGRTPRHGLVGAVATTTAVLGAVRG